MLACAPLSAAAPARVVSTRAFAGGAGARACVAPRASATRRDDLLAILSSHRRAGNAGTPSVSWAASPIVAARARPVRGCRAKTSAATGRANAKHIDDDDDEDAILAFVPSDPFAQTPEERKEAHRASCEEGRRRANEKRARRMTESIEGEVFRPRERIKSQSDFNAVGKRGRNFNGKVVRVQWLSNAGRREVNCTRLGIKTPKKQIKRAVDRNLVKRRVRDVYRKNKEAWPDSTDVVVYCSAATLEASYDDLRSELLYWGKEVVPRMAKDGPRERRAPFKKKRRDDASAARTTPTKETAAAGAKKSR